METFYWPLLYICGCVCFFCRLVHSGHCPAQGEDTISTLPLPLSPSSQYFWSGTCMCSYECIEHAYCMIMDTSVALLIHLHVSIQREGRVVQRQESLVLPWSSCLVWHRARRYSWPVCKLRCTHMYVCMHVCMYVCMYVSCMYRIRPNFRGAQFSRIGIFKQFAETFLRINKSS